MPGKMPDLFGSGEVRILRLETAAGLLALACVLLAALLLWQRVTGLPVCYGTAEVAPGLVIPNEVPDAHVRSLAEQVVLVRYNITPETAEAAYERLAPLFHPQLLTVFNAQAERELLMLREEDMSTQISIRNTVVGRPGGAYAARIDAWRRVFAGTLPIRDEEIGATVRFQRVQPSPVNPWGLALIGLEFTEPLRAETG